jgi:serine/threonine protein kinase
LNPGSFVLHEEPQSDLYVVKLVSYEYATYLNPDEKLTDTNIENRCFMAPEIYEGSYDHKSDWWSVGMILFSLLASTFAISKIRDDVKNETLKFEFDIKNKKLRGTSLSGREFLSNFLHRDP